MTKFKKCDYCKLESKTTEKYKTSFSELGTPAKGEEIQGGYFRHELMDLFYLCKGCSEFLIPEDKFLAKNKVDNDFFETELKSKLVLTRRWSKKHFSPRKGMIQ